MAARLIRDGLLESEAVLSLPAEARWVYVSILLSADDLGLFEATPFRIARKADIRRELADTMVQMLADRDLIRLYTVDGKQYGFVPRYRQRVQVMRPRCPIPPANLLQGDPDAIKKINNLGLNPTVGHGDPAVTHGDPPPEVEVEVEFKDKPPTPSGAAPAEPAGFVRFWSVWPKSPRKGGRSKCLEIWRRAKLESTAGTICSHVEAMSLMPDWRKESGAYIPAPSVYLNGRRWDGAELFGQPAVAATPWARAV